MNNYNPTLKGFLASMTFKELLAAATLAFIIATLWIIS
jgi:hypothetical protein